MADIKNGSWTTTFFYKQDLRSLYMNGLLKSIVKPGIYNPNIWIDISSESESDSSSGNGIREVKLHIGQGTSFVFNNSYSVEGDVFTRDFNGKGSYIIKSTTTDEYTFTLTNNSSSSNTVSYLSNPEKYKNVFVLAHITYDPDSDSSSTIPTFCLAEYNSSGNNKGFNVIGNDTIKFKEGQLSSETNQQSEHTSFLIVGSLIDLNDFTENESPYLSGEVNKSWKTDGAYNWINNHLFIGRGLPDYTQKFTDNSYRQIPSLLYNFNNDKGNFYLNIEKGQYNGNLFSVKIDWKNVFGMKSTTIGGELNLSSSSTDITSKKDSIGSDKDLIVTDFLYLPLNTSSSKGDSLNNVYTSTQEYPKLKCYEWVSEINKSDLNSIFKEDNKLYLDLDTSRFNTLMSLIENRNIVSNIIDTMRREDKFNGDIKNNILPIALVFRPFVVEEVTESNETKKTTTSLNTYVTTSNTRFNPTYVLSFLEMSEGSSSINNINITIPEVFDVLPIID